MDADIESAITEAPNTNHQPATTSENSRCFQSASGYTLDKPVVVELPPSEPLIVELPSLVPSTQQASDTRYKRKPRLRKLIKGIGSKTVQCLSLKHAYKWVLCLLRNGASKETNEGVGSIMKGLLTRFQLRQLCRKVLARDALYCREADSHVEKPSIV